MNEITEQANEPPVVNSGSSGGLKTERDPLYGRRTRHHGRRVGVYSRDRIDKKFSAVQMHDGAVYQFAPDGSLRRPDKDRRSPKERKRERREARDGMRPTFTKEDFD